MTDDAPDAGGWYYPPNDHESDVAVAPCGDRYAALFGAFRPEGQHGPAVTHDTVVEVGASGDPTISVEVNARNPLERADGHPLGPLGPRSTY